MAMAISCEVCAAHGFGDSAVERAERMRAQELLLAVLQGEAHAGERISLDYKGCPDCLARLAAGFLEMAAASRVELAGSAEAAAAAVRRDLDDVPLVGT